MVYWRCTVRQKIGHCALNDGLLKVFKTENGLMCITWWFIKGILRQKTGLCVLLNGLLKVQWDSK